MRRIERPHGKVVQEGNPQVSLRPKKTKAARHSESSFFLRGI